MLGCAHGIVLAIVLLRRARNRRANRYVAALLVALALLLFDGFLDARGVLAAHPHLIGWVAWLPIAIGPLVFLYVREMTAQGEVPPPWRHFIVTAAFVVMLGVTFYPRSAAYKLRIAAEHDLPFYVRAIELATLAYGIGYACAALVLLRRHRAHVQAVYSNLRGVSLRWLVLLVALNGTVWLAALVAYVIGGAGSPIVPIGCTATIFVLGYFQLGQAEIFPEPRKTYEKARLAVDDAAELEARITKSMTDKRLYQRGGLTLGELADEVAATPHEVSQVLSTRLGKNFYTFINEHRIEHVKAALAATERPVLELAFEAGFQSKSTFNAAFRKATGVTPREFRERARA